MRARARGLGGGGGGDAARGGEQGEALPRESEMAPRASASELPPEGHQGDSGGGANGGAYAGAGAHHATAGRMASRTLGGSGGGYTNRLAAAAASSDRRAHSHARPQQQRRPQHLRSLATGGTHERALAAQASDRARAHASEGLGRSLGGAHGSGDGPRAYSGKGAHGARGEKVVGSGRAFGDGAIERSPGVAGLALLSDLDLPPELDEPLTRQALSRDELDDWLERHTGGAERFASVALYCELRLRASQRATVALPSPNTTRTLVAAELLAALATKSLTRLPILIELLREVFSALFVDPDEASPQPYFVAYAEGMEELSRLRADLAEAHRAAGFWQRNAENRLASYSRAMTMLFASVAHEKFHLWRTSVVQRKMTRQKLDLAVTKFKRRAELMRAFSHWRDALLQSKLDVMSTTADELRQTTVTQAERIRELEGLLQAEQDAHSETKMEMQRLKDRLAEGDNIIKEQAEEIERLKAKLLAMEEESAMGARYAAEVRRGRRALAALAADEEAELRARMKALVDGTFQDCSVLLKQDEDTQSLLEVDPSQIMLRWANFHLQRQGLDTIRNFGADLADAKELVPLLRAALPDSVDAKLADEVDPLLIAQKCLGVMRQRIDLPEDVILPAEVLDKTTADLVYVALEQLFSFDAGLDLDRVSQAPTDHLDTVVVRARESLAQSPLIHMDEPGEDDDECIGAGARSLLEAMRDARRMVKREEESMWGLHATYMDARRRAANLSKECLAARVRGNVREMVDDSAEDEQVAYTQLVPARVMDIIPEGPGQAEALEMVSYVLGKHYKDLKRIFVFYSAGGFMSSAEYWKLMKDAKIPTKKFGSARIDLVFLKANKEYTDREAAGGVASEDNPDTELMPAEYVEAIVRLAWGRAGEKGELHEVVEKFIEQQILPNACKSDAEQFRRMLKEPDFAAVLATHRPALRKIFIKYSGADASDADGLTMNLKEVAQLFKDSLQISGGFTHHDVKKIFGNVQDAEGNDGDGADDDDELVFTEFIELLVCTCVYRDPNPFMPLDKRFSAYVTKDLVKPLKAAKKVKF